MNYNYPSKRHWRRTLWNIISKRVTVKKRNALILYLAGLTDEDRAIAKEKGFSRNNLIAIEHDPDVVKTLRAGGTLTLCGDALQHLHAWNPRRKVDVVLLDFCCGLTDSIFKGLFELSFHPSFQDSVVVINMLRGRDGSGNAWRLQSQTFINGMCLLSSVLADNSEAVKLGVISKDEFIERIKSSCGGYNTKHRGELLGAMLFNHLGIWLAKNMAANIGMNWIDLIEVQKGANFDDFAARLLNLAVVVFEFDTLSYRSISKQTFDTLIYINKFMNEMKIDITIHAEELEVLYRNSSIRRQQAAILAHRTMRSVG